MVKTDIDKYSDEDETFGIDRINLLDLEWYYVPYTEWRSTNVFTTNNINECMILNDFIHI